MLVMSRKKNESLVINNDVTVTVVEIREDKVRLGIVCPKDVPVHRQEVFDAIHGKPGASSLAAERLISIAGDDQYTRFLDGFAAGLRPKTGKVLSRGVVALALLSALEQSKIDLTKATEFEHLKSLLTKAALGESPPESGH